MFDKKNQTLFRFQVKDFIFQFNNNFQSSTKPDIELSETIFKAGY